MPGLINKGVFIMKALVLNQIKEPLVLEDRPEPKAGNGQVVVRLKAAALNRRDYWITQGLYPGMKLPIIPGSDGAGTVMQTGKEVIITPGINWGQSEHIQ